MGCMRRRASIQSVVRWLIGVWFVVLPFAALANPIADDPGPISPEVFIVAAALAVETGIVVFLAAFRGLRPFRFFCAFFVMNSLVFLVLFLPMLYVGIPHLLAEMLVVLMDGLGISALASSGGLQGDKFKGMNLGWALIISAVGNVGSFLIGWLWL